MEEKERYEFGQRTLFYSGEELTTFDGFNLDDFMLIICKLLNQQDKEIKELKNKLEHYCEGKWCIDLDRLVNNSEDLKRFQNQNTIEKLENLKHHFLNLENTTLGLIKRSDFVDYLNTQIKELGGEDV